MDSYLTSVQKQFEYYKLLGEKAMAQISDENLFWQRSEDENSVAIIVGHMAGNMLSRWTDFLTSDGEKEWRDRDKEFVLTVETREELQKRWSAGWHCLFTAIEGLNTAQLEQVIYIRNQGHTVIEAINRQLAHYAYHVGQIVFICKMMSAEPWESLSIPKNESGGYNVEKFAQPRSRQHFTDEFLESGD